MSVLYITGESAKIMKNEIIEIAKKNRITDVGFCGIEDYMVRAEDFKGVFLNNTPLDFAAKTAIVCIFNYFVNKPACNISRYAWGMDYHNVVRDKMKGIVRLLEERGYRAKEYADVGPFNERLLARLAGVAFIGKNRMAINEKCGSYFFIGYVVTDAEIEPDSENRHSCNNCGKCVAVCPLGAIGSGDFNQELCISYISQKKGDLSDKEKKALTESGKIWGCDKCQECCPHNLGIIETDIDEFKNNLIGDLHLDENMTNREFREMYGNRAFAWRGKSVIIRNQKCVYK